MTALQIKILGSGASVGTPVIGCECDVCLSKNPHDRRLRQSIHLSKGDTKVIIDCGPDIRQQCLKNGISQIDALFLTHAHQDHVGGVDDLRAFVYTACKPVDVYLDQDTLDALHERFDYLFSYKVKNLKGERTNILNVHIVEPGKLYKVKDIEFEVFEQDHGVIEGMGELKSLGYFFPNESFAYSTDVKKLSDEVFDKLTNIRLWFIECLGKAHGGYAAHLTITEVLEWIKRARAKQVVLIHISHELSHAQLEQTLPQHIRPGYDGMIVEI